MREGVLNGGYTWSRNFRFLPGPFTTLYNFSLLQRLRYDAERPYCSVSCLHSFVSVILSVHFVRVR